VETTEPGILAQEQEGAEEEGSASEERLGGGARGGRRPPPTRRREQAEPFEPRLTRADSALERADSDPARVCWAGLESGRGSCSRTSPALLLPLPGLPRACFVSSAPPRAPYYSPDKGLLNPKIHETQIGGGGGGGGGGGFGDTGGSCVQIRQSPGGNSSLVTAPSLSALSLRSLSLFLRSLSLSLSLSSLFPLISFFLVSLSAVSVSHSLS
jgi:hypothetical protein